MQDEGIHVMPIPTPFAVGPVNCYLIEDDPLTLIDPGPNSGDALDALDHQLTQLGHSIDDIELIVLSHQHIDHLGLINIVARHSGADVTCIDRCATYLENWEDEAAADDRFASEMMILHGIAPEVTRALRSVSAAFRTWGSSANVTRTFKDGDMLELRDRKLKIDWRPGHSPTDTTFFNEATGTLIAADHLIKHISSNPLLARPLDGEKRMQSLVAYIDSMAKTREMPASLVLSGHGEPILDHVGLIDARFAQRSKRTEKIYKMIVEQQRSAHALAQATWGNIAVTQAYLTLSEIIGHCDILINAGRVEEIQVGDHIEFKAIA